MGWIPEPGQGGGGGGGNAAYAETVGDGNTTSFDITHGLGSSDVAVEVIELSSGDALVHGTDYTWLILDEDEIRVVFSSAPGVDDARVVVLAAGGGGGGGGGRTLIDEVELESAQPQIVFTDIPQTFQDLEIVGYLRSARSQNATGIGIRFGPSAGLDTGNNYTTRYLASGVSGTSGVGSSIGVQAATAASAIAGRFGVLRARIIDYRRTGERLVFAEGYSIERFSVGGGSWISADPLQQIAIFDRDTGDNLVAGSRVRLYGLP